MPKATPLSAVRAAYDAWRALRLPWRKQHFAGRDLDGNTYWEFADLRSGTGGQAVGSWGAGGSSSGGAPPPRMRRIVQYPRGTHPGSVRVPPVWHQWLRHVRVDAPSVEEQEQEVARRARMRLLAAQADARWVGAQFVDAGGLGSAAPAVGAAQTLPAEATTARPALKIPTLPTSEGGEVPTEPWKVEELARAARDGQAWQPTTWVPGGDSQRRA